MTAFVGAPSTWGLLLRTIDIIPRKVTCITTSGQQIIAACGDVVNIYNAVTGVLQQSLSPSEPVKKIQASVGESTLFFAHSFSITMWGVQTGGLSHTFIAQSEVNDILLSTTGDYIACSFHDSVALWNTRNKQEGKGFRNNQPVVAMCWVSPQILVIATQNFICTHSVATGEILDSLPFSDHVWGMVYLKDKDEFLVGTLKPGLGTDQESYLLEAISHWHPEPLERSPTTHHGQLVRQKRHWEQQSPAYHGPLAHPTIVGKEIACITPPSGVQSFSTQSNDWTNKPPLLNAAVSVAVSLNRNLVVQTEDSIQIFSIDVLTSDDVHYSKDSVQTFSVDFLTSRGVHDRVHLSHVYPWGKEYILCLRANRHITLLDLETLREIYPGDKLSLLGVSLYNLSHSSYWSRQPEVVTGLGFREAIRSWGLGVPIPEGFELAGGQTPRDLCTLSPGHTTALILSAGHLWVTFATSGVTFAALDVDNLGGGEVYDITFDSETRFYLKVDGPDQHFKVPYDMVLAPGQHSPSIIKGQPEPLSEPRVTPPYSLDANCEWVLDAESRKICWISPGNVRRGDGGHFWIGTTLFMVGGDGVLRKVTFKDPDC